MKKALFISITKYNLEKDIHLEKKFQGLSQEIQVYLLGRGDFLHQRAWNTEFYLFPHVFYWPLVFLFAPWLCLVRKIDVVVAQSPLIEGFLGTIIKRILKKELIVEIHGDWQEGPFLSKKRRLAFIERKFIPFLAKFSLRNADKIRGVSTNLIAEAKKITSDKQYFIFPTFTDLDDFLNEQNTSFDNFILFVGHLQKVKGLDYLIEAFDKIKDDFPEFKLVLIGQGTETLKAGDNVELKGRLSLEQTRNIMKNCYCLVLPSLSEGLPRVIMEAMVLGKPVIGSNVGGIPDLIKDGQSGFLFKAGDSNELAEKLRILLKSRDLATEMGQRGRELIQNRFSNEKYIANYIQMINS